MAVEQGRKRVKALAGELNAAGRHRIEWADRKLGVIASGPVYHYAKEIFPSASFLKLGMTYPLPHAMS